MAKRKDARELVHRNQMLMPWAHGRTVSTTRAAELLNACPTTIREMIERKELRAYKLRPSVPGSNYRVFVDSLRRHIEGIMQEYELQDYE